jgi:SAM-dependent methyltransferase
MTWEEAVKWLRSQPDQQDLVKACFYDDPLTKAAERYHASTEWQAIRHYLPKTPGRVLDIGAGRGITSYAFASDGWQVDALEPNASDLVGGGAIRELATETGTNIRVEQNWGEQLPYPDATFDVVHGRQVLHHARDLQALCAEAARVLKPGGIFIATREHVISQKADMERFLAQHALHHLYGGESAYLLKEYQQAISAAGIKLSHTLNPYITDINLYPETKTSLKKAFQAKLKLPVPIPDMLLNLYSLLNDTPGRLYTFVGIKHA